MDLEMQNRCFDLKDDKNALAKYLSVWLEESIGMTAIFNTEYNDEIIGTSNSEHPSTQTFSDVHPEHSERDLASCQAKFQSHRCRAYCMRNRTYTRSDESEEEKKRRVCRCGTGIEKHFMKCDTPGFKVRPEPLIKRDLRGFDRVDLVRNNTTITQSSKYLIRAWCGNCDIQLMIYKCKPDNVDPKDVSRVSNYIVSYACKGSETVVEE